MKHSKFDGNIHENSRGKILTITTLPSRRNLLFFIHRLTLLYSQFADISSSLRIEEKEGDEYHTKSEKLQETHTDEGICEEVLLHRGVSCDTNDQCREELSDALSASTNSDNRDGATQDRSARITNSTKLSIQGVGRLQRSLISKNRDRR